MNKLLGLFFARREKRQKSLKRRAAAFLFILVLMAGIYLIRENLLAFVYDGLVYENFAPEADHDLLIAKINYCTLDLSASEKEMIKFYKEYNFKKLLITYVLPVRGEDKFVFCSGVDRDNIDACYLNKLLPYGFGADDLLFLELSDVWAASESVAKIKDFLDAQNIKQAVFLSEEYNTSVLARAWFKYASRERFSVASYVNDSELVNRHVWWRSHTGIERVFTAYAWKVFL